MRAARRLGLYLAPTLDGVPPRRSGRAERHRGVHRQLDGSRVGLVADDGQSGVAGYAAGEVTTTAKGSSTSWPSTPPLAGPASAGSSSSPSPASSSIDRCSGAPHGAGPSNAGPDPLRTTRPSGPTDRSSPTARGRCNDTSLVGRPALSMPTSTTRTTAVLPGPRLAGRSTPCRQCGHQATAKRCGVPRNAG